MSDLTPREHALRVAVLDVLADEVNAGYKAARKEAEPAFAEVRKGGTPQQEALLPDGTKIGLISIRGGGAAVTPDEAAVTAWVREHNPEGIEDYLIPQAVQSADVVALVKAYYPELVASRVRGPVHKALIDEARSGGGYVVDPDSGEKGKIADVAEGDPSGAFAWRPGPEARDKIIAAWRHGDLRGVDLGPLALPAGGVADD